MADQMEIIFKQDSRLEGRENFRTALLRTIQEHVGEENAISQEELLKEMRGHFEHVSNRDMRDQIMYLRFNVFAGAWICSKTSTGGGYYIAADDAELKKYYDSEKKRALMIISKIEKQIRRASPVLAGQLGMKVSFL